MTKDTAPIADEIAWSLIPRESLRELMRNPFRCRMSCGADPDKIFTAEPYNDEGVEQIEASCRHDKQIHRGDIRGMIAKKGAPTLTRWPLSLGQIFTDA